MAYKRADFKLDETNDIDKRIEEAEKMFRERGLNATVWYDQDECVYKCSDQTGLWKSIDCVKWDKIEVNRMEKIVRSPTFETKIIKAVFLNQEIVVFPRKEKVPNNITEVVRFLFGEGAVVMQDCVNNSACVRITNANYVLDNVKTINAEWEYKEVKDV